MRFRRSQALHFDTQKTKGKKGRVRARNFSDSQHCEEEKEDDEDGTQLLSALD